MPGQTEPSSKERAKKLREAAEALAAGRWVVIAEDRHLIHDMNALGCNSAREYFTKITGFLDEIAASGGSNCYAGAFPPYKCYHDGFRDIRLYAFAWDSPGERRRLYLKFGIRLNKAGVPTFLYLNCHDDDPDKKNR